MSEILGSPAIVPPTKPLSPVEAFEELLRLVVADGDARPRTLAAYRAGLEIFLGWCQAAGLDPRGMGEDALLEYRRWLNERYERATVMLRLTAVRVLFTAMQRWGLRRDNPAAGLRSPKKRAAATAAILRKALSPAEACRLLTGLEKCETPMQARNRAIITLMIFHGLRAEEVSTLLMDSLDRDRLSMTRLFVYGKGEKMRVLVLEPQARESLVIYLRMTGQEIQPAHKSEPLFFRLDQPERCRLSVRAIERIVDAELARHGLKQRGRSAHSLRHTYGLLAALGGAEREALAESLGHESMRTTDIYVRAAAAFQHNPSGAVSAALQRKGEP
jgi:site-specific recombinase XerD